MLKMTLKENRKNNEPNATKKLSVSFTNRQIDEIELIVKSGEWGSTMSEVIREIVLFYLRKNKI